MKDRDWLWWLAAAGVLVVLAAPFCLVDAPPVLDYPNHLARLYVLAFGAGDPVLSAMYAPHWQVLPNLVLDIIGPPLMRLLPVSVAGRLLLAGAALLPVIGVVAYHRAVFGRGSYWPLACALVAFNGIFFLGFINFLYSVGLAFLAAAFWIRVIDRRPAAAVVGAIFAAVGLFLCHLFGVLIFGLLIGAHELAGLWPLRGDTPALLRRGAVRVLALLVVFLAPFGLYLASPLAGVDGAAAWDAPTRKLIDLLTPFMTYSQGLSLLTCVVVVASFVLLRRQASADRGTAIALIVVAAIYSAAPSSMKSGTFVDVRLPLVMALMVFAGFAPRLSPRSAMALVAGGAAFLIVRTGYVAAVWHAHGEDLAELRAAYAPVEAGAKVLVASAADVASPDYLAAEPAGRRIPGLFRTDEHLAGLMLIERHAFWPHLFADPRQQPLAVLPPYAALADPLGELPSVRQLAVDTAAGAGQSPYLADWPQKFDYVLLLDAGAIDAAALRPDRLQLLNRSDMATLYRVRRP